MQTLLKKHDLIMLLRQELFDMYQQLIQFKNNLVGIFKPNSINSISFAHNFLSIAPIMQYQQLRLPSIDYEYKLSTSQKIQFLKVRDQELEKLKKDIFELHLCIAFYINEIIERRDLAYKEYQQFGDQFSQFAEQWNMYTSNLPYNIAIETYSLHFVWQDTLNNLEIKTQEVECFLKYYKSLETGILISKTTNFSNIFNPQLCINKDIFTSIKDSRCNWQFNMMTIEDYLRRNNWLSQQLINTLKNQIQQRRVVYEKDLIALAKKKKNAADNLSQNNVKKQSPVQIPNIKGSDKDPDDDFFEKMKKIAKRKALHHKYKKFYKDPQTDLWWSKDNGSAHAGPHYKVFQERATHLEWIRDVDLLGKVMEKHKGPVGRIIPFKELIFY